MTRRALLVLAGLAMAPTPGAAADPAAQGQPPVVFIVRHAEAGDTRGGGDPQLTEAGAARAQALAHLLEPARVTHLFASQYSRTQATLRPLAERLSLEVTVVPAADGEALIERLRALPPRSVAAVAGHSNTVPALVRALGGTITGTTTTEHGETLDHDSYDRLFGIVLTAPAASFELRYGP